MDPPSSKAFSKSKHQLAKNRDKSHGRGGRGRSGKPESSQASNQPQLQQQQQQPSKSRHPAPDSAALDDLASSDAHDARGRDFEALLDEASQFFATPLVRQNTLMASLAAPPFPDVAVDDVPAQVCGLPIGTCRFCALMLA